MKVITNQTIIAKRRKQATTMAPIAMVLLLGGLFVNLSTFKEQATTPIYSYIILVLLLTGFISSVISSGLVSRWVKEPRADQQLSTILDGFDNKHTLLNYTSKVPHVLIAPNKLYAITVKNQDGVISVKKDKWNRKFN